MAKSQKIGIFCQIFDFLDRELSNLSKMTNDRKKLGCDPFKSTVGEPQSFRQKYIVQVGKNINNRI